MSNIASLFKLDKYYDVSLFLSSYCIRQMQAQKRPTPACRPFLYKDCKLLNTHNHLRMLFLNDRIRIISGFRIKRVSVHLIMASI